MGSEGGSCERDRCGVRVWRGGPAAVGAGWAAGARGCASPPCAQDSQYVVAVRNYSPGDGDQLSFHKGDIIHLQPLEHPERGERPPQPAVVKCPQWGAQRWRD